MMIEPAGLSRYITIGKRIDMVEAGPSPGSTPIRVPRKQPMKQYRSSVGSSTLPMPPSTPIRSPPLFDSETPFYISSPRGKMIPK